MRAQWRVLRDGGAGDAWMQAIHRHDVPTIERLMGAGVSAQGVDDWTLFTAMDLKDPRLLLASLAMGANPNAHHSNNYNDFLIHRAVARGRRTHVDALLAAGVDVSVLDGNGFTPLMTALNGFGDRAVPWEERRPLLPVLLKAGADPSFFGAHDREAALAVAPVEVDVVALLVAHGADPQAIVNPQPAGRWVWHGPIPETSLLFRADQLSDAEALARWLEAMPGLGVALDTPRRDGALLPWHFVEQGALARDDWPEALAVLGQHYDVTGTDPDGNTLLHVWVQERSSDWCAVGEAMLDHPGLAALVTARNRDGKTASDLAQGRLDWMSNSDEAMALADRLKAMTEGVSLDHGTAPAQPAATTMRPTRRL